MTLMIPHSRPTIDKKDAELLSDVLLSGNIAQGEKVAEFERQMARFLGLKGCVATSSGTAALHLSLIALGVGEGDQVLLPTYVCAALLNAVNYVRATPVLVDINPQSFNLDVHDLNAKLTPKSKAVILPHMFGLPADIDEIMALGIPVIEDCAQAVGATFQGRPVGSFGMLAVFSFYATKIMTTGEGGMVASHSEDLLEKVKDLREYDEKNDYRVRFNYKMSDLQAALGLSQLARLADFITHRRKIASLHSAGLKRLPVDLPQESEDRRHIFFRYVIRTKKPLAAILRSFQQRGVCCRRPVYKPLHRLLGLSGFHWAEEVAESVLSLPIYPSLKDEETEKIVEAAQEILR
ncbi:MAG: DegT/DnrJ/EryC1/StrS family aminotransferase [Candidatus Latescibacteria bacterium]|nr:DegT/DnrJ/EryC1/StrS family aminotransferase [Candidatus Latescibacterota bacterium]